MVKYVYIGGIKENNSQICQKCGYKSQEIQGFFRSSWVLNPTIIVEEICLDCYTGKNKDIMIN